MSSNDVQDRSLCEPKLKVPPEIRVGKRDWKSSNASAAGEFASEDRRRKRAEAAFVWI